MWRHFLVLFIISLTAVIIECRETIVRIVSPGETVVFDDCGLNFNDIGKLELHLEFPNGGGTELMYSRGVFTWEDSTPYITQKYCTDPTFGRLRAANQEYPLQATPLSLTEVIYDDSGIYLYKIFDNNAELFREFVYEVVVVAKKVELDITTTPSLTTVPTPTIGDVTFKTSSTAEDTMIIVSNILLITMLFIIFGTSALYIITFKKSWIDMCRKTQSTPSC